MAVLSWGAKGWGDAVFAEEIVFVKSTCAALQNEYTSHSRCRPE